MILHWGSLDLDSVSQWADLINELAVFDDTQEFYRPGDLAEELAEPGVDPALDTLAVRDPSGALIAFGQVTVAAALRDGWVSAYVGGGVRPDHRGLGVGRDLMDRLEQRALALSALRHPGAPVNLRASGGLAGASVRPLLEHRGYGIARYFTRMERPLPGDPVPSPALAVVPFTAELSEATRLAHNDAFSTHWGSTARSVDEWDLTVLGGSFRPDCSFVSLAPDGIVLAYTLCQEFVDGELYVATVGTRQQARGTGLARACLLAALSAAASDGRFRLAQLEVDSENPTSAGALYESVGFTAVATTASYVREVPSAG